MLNATFDRILDGFLGTEVKNTANSNRVTLEQFCECLNIPFRSPKLLKVTQADILTFIDWLKKRPGQAVKGKPAGTLAMSSVRLRIDVLAGLYRAFADYNLIKIHPITKAITRQCRVRRQVRPTEIFDFDKARQMINMPSRFTRPGIRDRAMLSCFIAGGLRRNEVTKLTLGDCRLTNKGTFYLLLRDTKSQEDQIVAFHGWGAEPIGRLIEQRKSEGGTNDDPLFINYRGRDSTPGKALCESTVYRSFKRWCAKAGLNPVRYSPHSARATAITKALSEGKDYGTVKKFSRHSSITMVEQYDKRYLSADEVVGPDFE